jgi:hypothetical protein
MNFFMLRQRQNDELSVVLGVVLVFFSFIAANHEQSRRRIRFGRKLLADFCLNLKHLVK